MRWLTKLWLNKGESLPENLGSLQVEALFSLVHTPNPDFFGGGNNKSITQEDSRILLNVE